MKVMITGAAGFIGAHTAHALEACGDTMVLVDNFSHTIYDPQLKRDRIQALVSDYQAVKEIDLLDYTEDDDPFARLCKNEKPDVILHLAAIAGIRYAQKHPLDVVRNNFEATARVFQCAVEAGIPRVVYASSASVYGRNTKVPFSESDPVDKPSSYYAVTKRACEQLAEMYKSTSKLHTTGLRFFTAYGPWGRPDMAYYKFTDAIFNDAPLTLFADGQASRDFTYIDDIVAGVVEAVHATASSTNGNAIINLGNAHPHTNGELLALLEKIIGKKAASKTIQPLPLEDVRATYADVAKAKMSYRWEPHTPLETGLRMFVEWYKNYHHV